MLNHVPYLEAILNILFGSDLSYLETIFSSRCVVNCTSAAHTSKASADETHADGDQSMVATLSEVILAEQSDFDAKLARLARRRRWLKTNKALLRTLLSFSVLHGSCGGGLVSMRMELLLLLQELQQQPASQKLLTTPVPLPTSLPLLSASVAVAKTVVADPMEHLYSMTYDLLHTIVECRSPPDTKTHPNKVCSSLREVLLCLIWNVLVRI